MSRIFISDFSIERINVLQSALRASGHEVFSNLTTTEEDPNKPYIATEIVDVAKILLKNKPFPDLIIAEADKMHATWLGGLIYDMELGNKSNLILLAKEENEKIKQLTHLYGAHYWPEDAKLSDLLEYIKTFFAITC